MGRFYRTTAPQNVDYMYKQPTELMYNVINKADETVNKLQDQQDLYETTIGSVPLQVIPEYKDLVSESIQPFTQQINDFTDIFNRGDGKEILRRKNDLRQAGKKLQNELTFGKTGRYLQRSQQLTNALQQIMADKDIDPELRDLYLSSRYDDGYLAQQIQRSITEDTDLYLPPVPKYFDIVGELRKAAKDMGVEESEIGNIIKQGPRGYFSQTTIKEKYVDPAKAEAVFEGILSDPRYQAAENFRSNILGEKYAIVGKDRFGSDLYLSKPEYVQQKLTDQANIYGFNSVSEHIEALRQPYINKLNALTEKYQNGKLKEGEYNKQVNEIRKELESVESPVNEQYAIVNRNAMSTLTPENALTGAEIRRNRLLQTFMGATPGRTRSETDKLIQDVVGMENLRQSNAMAKLAVQQRHELELIDKRAENAEKLEKLKAKYKRSTGKAGENLNFLTGNTGVVGETSLFSPGSATWENQMNTQEGIEEALNSLSANKISNPELFNPDTDTGRANFTRELNLQTQLTNIKNTKQDAINQSRPTFNQEVNNLKKEIEKIGKSTFFTMKTQQYEKYMKALSDMITPELMENIVINNQEITNKKQLANILQIPENIVEDDLVKKINEFQTKTMPNVTKKYMTDLQNTRQSRVGTTVDLTDPIINTGITGTVSSGRYDMTDSNNNKILTKDKGGLTELLENNGLTIADIISTQPKFYPLGNGKIAMQFSLKPSVEIEDRVIPIELQKVENGKPRKTDDRNVYIEIPTSHIGNKNYMFGEGFESEDQLTKDFLLMLDYPEIAHLRDQASIINNNPVGSNLSVLYNSEGNEGIRKGTYVINTTKKSGKDLNNIIEFEIIDSRTGNKVDLGSETNRATVPSVSLPTTIASIIRQYERNLMLLQQQ